MFDGLPRRNRLNRKGHYVPGLALGINPAFKVPEQGVFHLHHGLVFDRGRGGKGVPPSPEGQQDFSHVDFPYTAAGDEVDSVLHSGKGKQAVEVFHVHQLVNQDREIPHIIVGGGLGHDDFHVVDRMPGGRFQELIEQGNLLDGQFPGQQVGDQVQVGPLLEEIGGRLEVLPAWWSQR